jgi:transcriptional regulator with XRE-family HTH domain
MEGSLKFWYGMSDPAILVVLGNFIQKTRMSQNRTQQAVSEAAGINRSTLVSMEKGNGGTLLSFVQVLRALEQLQVLEIFDVKPEISPLQLAESGRKYRLRARPKPSSSNNTKSTW